ncbi:DUF3488 domain-containing protein [Hahella sp. KA22]|uniref:transglutaminase TgpA family protein n=1 Tax=Hahella sp. KA22 TaxID=1628392 RepID=UPI000FDE0CBA|nr:DUF3488 and DUF4129 domain-containing transglutaminase family protein [Hahella sp. KA22]AZZ93046.1 DUF3488 domain-containing protein [Hahella sp. KA22]QAY56420.1 DUF3488 domain-containing protein [Hahella sp. KA22]
MFKRSFDESPALDTRALVWMVVSLAAAAGAHWNHVPVWLLGFACVSVFWRTRVYQGKWPAPSTWVKGGVMVVTSIAYVFSTQAQFTVETAVGFFVLAYALKLLELNQRRDAFLFSFMTLFLLCLGFLFSQSLFVSLYIFIAMGLSFVALMAVNQSLKSRSIGSTFKGVYGSMAVAAPLLIVMYLFFPRFGPLWAMPLKSSTAFTGLDENMSPGDVANLAQSGERAFRIVFNGPRPAYRELYWRALILDRYDGTSWKRSFSQTNRDRQGAVRPGARTQTEQWDYEVLLEPHNREWGFALDDAKVARGAPFSTPDQLVRFMRDVKSPEWYRVISQAEEYRENAQSFARFSSLPQGSNSRTAEWAKQLRETTPDAEIFIKTVLTHFNQEPYVYTLSPPLLTSANRIDEFFFDTRRGFCEHYASTMAFILRAANIPSRVLAGYQGGEWNEQGGFLVVHQYDAHAWVEAWLPERGWVRVDPTAAVAPQRVESGIRDAVAEEGTFLQNTPLSLARYNHIGVFAWMTNNLEYMNYMWQKWVVNYDQEKQSSFFKRWFGDSDMKTMLMILAGVSVIVFLALSLLTLKAEWRRNKGDPMVRLYRSLLSRMHKKGLALDAGLTPGQALALATKKWPRQRKQLQQIFSEFEQNLYADDAGGSPDRVRRLKRDIKQLALNP